MPVENAEACWPVVVKFPQWIYGFFPIENAAGQPPASSSVPRRWSR
jgi:hypothetical protein